MPKPPSQWAPPTPNPSNPMTVQYVEVDVCIVMRCNCGPHNAPLIIRRTYQFLECPKCKTRYFVEQIAMDAKAYYDEQIAAGKKPEEVNMRDVPTRVSIGRQIPTIIGARES